MATATRTAGVLGGFAWLNYRTDRRRQLEVLRREQEVLTNQLAASLALPIWNFVRPQIARVVEGTPTA